MPIKPAPYKLKCPKCRYSKIVNLSSDALSFKDMLQMSTTCPKCSNEMQRVKMNIFDAIFGNTF